jgi:hypothetical protein
MACLRLVTFFPDRPLRKVPRLRSCMARSTFFDAFLLYFLAMGLLLRQNITFPTKHKTCQMQGVACDMHSNAHP